MKWVKTQLTTPNNSYLTCYFKIDQALGHPRKRWILMWVHTHKKLYTSPQFATNQSICLHQTLWCSVVHTNEINVLNYALSHSPDLTIWGALKSISYLRETFLLGLSVWQKRSCFRSSTQTAVQPTVSGTKSSSEMVVNFCLRMVAAQKNYNFMPISFLKWWSAIGSRGTLVSNKAFNSC